ncbi:Hypothetical_protein [Hexamita inflata]|uniref:Hypothetical_protein n=1 Tax=Hexamita inflata TaxID=28002 RepID=A0AA86UNJ9_9EUKA|nr:Hypothetical protein HINF_LOCUS49694 [Hexamita inflata]
MSFQYTKSLPPKMHEEVSLDIPNTHRFRLNCKLNLITKQALEIAINIWTTIVELPQFSIVAFPLSMRRKYSVEQNEEFYLAAAKTYQDTFDVRNCISPSGQVVKEVFFAAYRDRFGYGLGLFKTKEEAKRMRDGITKFFKARFVEKMQRYTNKGMDFEQLMALVMGEFQPYLLTCDIHDAVHTFKRTLDADIQQLQARKTTTQKASCQFTPKLMRPGCSLALRTSLPDRRGKFQSSRTRSRGFQLCRPSSTAAAPRARVPLRRKSNQPLYRGSLLHSSDYDLEYASNLVIQSLNLSHLTFRRIYNCLEHILKCHSPSPHYFWRVSNSTHLVWVNKYIQYQIDKPGTSGDSHARSQTYSKSARPDRTQLCCRRFKEQENILGSRKK